MCGMRKTDAACYDDSLQGHTDNRVVSKGRRNKTPSDTAKIKDKWWDGSMQSEKSNIKSKNDKFGGMPQTEGHKPDTTTATLLTTASSNPSASLIVKQRLKSKKAMKRHSAYGDINHIDKSSLAN